MQHSIFSFFNTVKLMFVWVRIKIDWLIDWFSDYCHFAGVPVEEGLVTICTIATVKRHQRFSLMAKLPPSLAILDLIYLNDVYFSYPKLSYQFQSFCLGCPCIVLGLGTKRYFWVMGGEVGLKVMFRVFLCGSVCLSGTLVRDSGTPAAWCRG